MLQPHVLVSLSEPRQRLGVTENALFLPVCVAAVLFVFDGIVSAVAGWLVVHGAVFVACRMDPHFMNVLKARRFYRKTIGRAPGGGNAYGA